MSRRTERLGSLLQQELAAIIQRELVDPRITGFPSITKVRVSEDLATADVYLTIMGTDGQQSAALNAIRHSGGLMRSRLTKELSMRTVPFLKFHIDEQLKKELEVLKLLGQVKLEEAEMAERAEKRAEEDAALAERDAKKAALREERKRVRDEEREAAREARRLAREAGESGVPDEEEIDAGYELEGDEGLDEGGEEENGTDEVEGNEKHP